MIIRKRIASLFGAGRREQVLGYSVKELKAIFNRPIAERFSGDSTYPRLAYITDIGVEAAYLSILIEARN